MDCFLGGVVIPSKHPTTLLLPSYPAKGITDKYCDSTIRVFIRKHLDPLWNSGNFNCFLRFSFKNEPILIKLLRSKVLPYVFFQQEGEGIPLAMLKPRFSSSLYSWQSAQGPHQKWTHQSKQGDSCKLYCARMEERLVQPYSHWQPIVASR